MDKKTKNYLDLLKEISLHGGTLTERDFQFIDDLHQGIDIEMMSNKYKIGRERVRQVIRDLNRKISLDIDSLLSYYLKLKKKEFDLTKKELELNKREERIARFEEKYRLSIERNENVIDYPDELFLPFREFRPKKLSTKTINSLLIADCYQMSDVMLYSKSELLRFRNMGEKCLWEIEDYLKEYGFELKP